MSQTVNLVVANNVGCGMPEGKCFPCSLVFGRTTAVYSCPSIGRHRIRSHVKIGGLKSGSLAASFVCQATRNPDFSKQNNRNGPSRGKNRNNDGRNNIFENFEEDMLSSKNGSVVSLSSGKLQGTSSPGPREKEIVELFKKVQARLRERASGKEEKKIEAPPAKEKNAVDSLIDRLSKQSARQGKKSSREDSGKHQNFDQLLGINQYDEVQSTDYFDSNNSPKDESRDVNNAFVARPRPRSVFRRKSPVPRVKYQPVSYSDDETDDETDDEIDEDNVINRHQIDLKPEDEPEPELKPKSELLIKKKKKKPKSEIDLDTKDELFFPELLEDDSHDAEQTYNDKSVEEQLDVRAEDLSALKLSELDVQAEDLSALKLPELRALAKSRGVKGYSKMKKGDLIELLNESLF